jgi:hypothetical protein
MRLRIAASMLTLLCSWVLWEKWISHNVGEPTARLVQAVLETKTLSECRAASPDFVKQRADLFRNSYKEPDYAVVTNDYSTILVQKSKSEKQIPQQYVFYCLPSTVDPYKDPR